MTGGYLKKKCVTCGKMIYLYRERDGRWRAYESWVAGTVPEGEWARHLCQEFTRLHLPAVLSDPRQPGAGGSCGLLSVARERPAPHGKPSRVQKPGKAWRIS